MSFLTNGVLHQSAPHLSHPHLTPPFSEAHSSPPAALTGQEQGKLTLHQLQCKPSASVICQRNVNTKGGLHAREARWETSSAVNVYNCLL